MGSALCSRLAESGHHIRTIVTPSPVRGKQLAESFNAVWKTEPVFDNNTDIIIVSVPDNKLRQVLSGIVCGSNTVVAHTAGSFGLEVFPERITRKGVFYPLQTFSEGRMPDFRDLPLLLEESDPSTGCILRQLATTISHKVHFVDLEKRRVLHLAAVFACNFTNHMLTAANEISGSAGFSPDMLAPLIKETFSKALSAGPENSQTGPAVRNDIITISKHLELLSAWPAFREMYRAITDSITGYYKKD